MKVFNWVHRAFVHHNNQRSTADSLRQGPSDYDVVLVRKNKGGSGYGTVAAAEVLVTNEDRETKPLLKHAGSCHGLGLDDIDEAGIDNIDGFWRDGILTIGTFGLHPLDQPNYIQAAQCYPIIYDQEKAHEKGEEEEDDDDETTPKNVDGDEENELNPLVSSISSKLRLITAGSNNNDHFNAEAGEHKMVIMMNLDSVTTAPHFAPEVNAMLGKEADDYKKKGERRTLAELFMEDQSHSQQIMNGKMKRRRRRHSHNHNHNSRHSNHHQLLDSDSVSDTGVTVMEPQVGSCSDPKSAFGAHKNTLSLVKKLIPKVTEDCRLARQLHHFMKKMLKRKIYPELQPHQMGMSSWDEDEVGAEETLSLL